MAHCTRLLATVVVFMKTYCLRLSAVVCGTRSSATSVQGDDMSVSLVPSKIKFSGMRVDDPETEGGEEEEEEADDASADLTFNFSVELHVSELFSQKN